MYRLVLCLILFAVAAGLVVFSRRAARHELPGASWFKIGGWAVAALSAIVLLLGFFYVVPTKHVGIPVTFGKPGPSVTNGIHVKMPWTHVIEMDATNHTDDHTGDNRSQIRLGNQSQAYVQNVIVWSIRPEAADQLYKDYTNPEAIGPSLVEPQVKQVLNDAFRNYNPLNAATSSSEQSLDQIASEVKSTLTKTIGDRIIIQQVTISKIDFDDQTQSRIDSLQTEIGNTRIAEQKKKTAAAEAEANRILAASVSKDPNVLVSKCLDQLSEMVTKGQPVPAGFSCWPGQSSQVIADATSKTSTDSQPAGKK